MTLTKLTVKAKRNLSNTYKAMSVETILVVCAMLKERQQMNAKESDNTIKKIRHADQDSLQRMQFCLKVLSSP